MTGTTVLLSADAESYWAKDEQARMAERLSALGLALMTSGLEPVPANPEPEANTVAPKASPSAKRLILKKKGSAGALAYGNPVIFRSEGTSVKFGRSAVAASMLKAGHKAPKSRTGAARKSGGSKTS